VASSVTTISVTICGETSGFTSEGQTLNLIRHLWRPIKPAENALLELRLKLGSALLQIKGQIAHGR